MSLRPRFSACRLDGPAAPSGHPRAWLSARGVGKGSSTGATPSAWPHGPHCSVSPEAGDSVAVRVSLLFSRPSKVTELENERE